MPRKKVTEDVVMTQRKQKKASAFVAVLVVVGLFVIVGAVLLGRSDSGQIDVNKAIENSNQSLRDAGGTGEGEVETVREVFRNKPNGGLQPQEGGQSAPQETTPSTDEVASTTATTTEEAISDEAVDGEEESEGGAVSDETVSDVSTE
jgi:hypothetical protein